MIRIAVKDLLICKSQEGLQLLPQDQSAAVQVKPRRLSSGYIAARVFAEEVFFGLHCCEESAHL